MGELVFYTILLIMVPVIILIPVLIYVKVWNNITKLYDAMKFAATEEEKKKAKYRLIGGLIVLLIIILIVCGCIYLVSTDIAYM